MSDERLPNGDIRRLELGLEAIAARFDAYLIEDREYKREGKERAERRDENMARVAQSVAVMAERLDACVTQLTAQQASLIAADRQAHAMEMAIERPRPLCEEHAKSLQGLRVDLTQMQTSSRIYSSAVSFAISTTIGLIVAWFVRHK